MIPTDFDLSAAVERYQKSHSQLDHFCIDEMVGYFVTKWHDKNCLKDTPENRNTFLTSLRNHLSKLNKKDYVKNE